jgi:hypothetical protein
MATKDKLTLTLSRTKLARITAMAAKRELSAEQFAEELIEIGLLSLKADWPKLSTGGTLDASYSVTVDLDGI